MLIGICGALCIPALAIFGFFTISWSSDSADMAADVVALLIDVVILPVYIFGIIKRKLKATRIAFRIWLFFQVFAVAVALLLLFIGDEDFVKEPIRWLSNLFWAGLWVLILWQGLRGLEKVVKLEDKPEAENIFMKNLINSQSVGLFLVSLSIGIILGAMSSFVKGHKSDSATPIRSELFGDITATIEDRHQKEPNDIPTRRQVLIVEKEGWPWLIVHKAPSGDVNEIALPVLGTDKLVASGQFQGNKMVEFGILHDSPSGLFAVFDLRYDQERNKWGEGLYVGGPPGETLREPYMDIDFDGQMDAASIMDPNYKLNYKVISSKIYVNGDWQKVDWVVPPDRKASLKVGDGKIHYKFIDGKGWRKSEDPNKPTPKEM
jgi:hypothetical protein